MKKNRLLQVIPFALVFLLAACDAEVNSGSSSKSEASSSKSDIISAQVSSEPLSSSEPSGTSVSSELLTSEISSADSSDTSIESSSAFSYSFPQKEQGLTLDEVTAIANELPAKENRKIRYTYHIYEKLVGTYPMTMAQGGDMPEGEYTLDLVTETRTHNLNADLNVISGTTVTKMQKFYTTYTASITPKGWLSYHAQRRQFLNSAQEGEGFEERFYNNPLTLWMMIWGNRPANAQMDGTYFGLNEYERVYNSEGYCVSVMLREFYYMKGTLSTYKSSHYYDGTYEIIANCTLEYLDEPNE